MLVALQAGTPKPRGLLAVLFALTFAGMAAPQVDAFVYWTNNANGTIGRANLDGNPAGVNQSFITGASFPDGVAVDGTHIYWANDGNGTIGRADLDGNPAGVNQSFITGASSPRGVAVDGAHIYWANEASGAIGRADLDGKPASVNQSLITGADSPFGVAVDAAHVYWANHGVGGNSTTIGRANLDGTPASVKQNFISGASGPWGLAVYAANLYWANTGAKTIGRATLDGTIVNYSFITGASGPAGVAVDALQPSSPGTTPGTTNLPLPPATLRATISALSETHSVFRAGLKSTPLLGRTTRSFPRGTTFSFRLDQPAVVTVRIQRKRPGRRVGRVCKPPSRLLRFRPRCTRLVLKATLRRSARVGLNRIAFSGRIRGRALPAGYYRATFTATNTAGTSALHALSFRIVAP